MIRRFFITLCVLISALLIVSCNKDALIPGIRPVQMEIGVVTYVGGRDYFEITDDSKNIYIVEDDIVLEYGIVEGKRLYVYYYNYVDVTDDNTIRQELRGKGRRIWKINIDKLQFVLSKPAIRNSFILENEKKRRDSIGYDPIRPYEDHKAWLGGDFLNIRFEYLRYDTEVRHLINLVWDDVRQQKNNEDDYVHLYLRHNAYGELPGGAVEIKDDTGICSFNLTPMVPKGKGSIKVKLFWDWYPDRESSTMTEEYCSDLGEFTPGGTNKGDVSTESGSRYYYISPPENPTAFVK